MNPMSKPGLVAAERNNYFYGKLLDVWHFTLETNYMNAKRWMINRRVMGVGVVFGLGLEYNKSREQVLIEPGLALDQWGREIIVTQPAIYDLPQDVCRDAWQNRHQGEDVYVSVWLCYKECLGDPVPALAGDCNTSDDCMPGTIREQYEIQFRPEPSPPVQTHCRIPNLITRGCLNYPALVEWVSQLQGELPANPCIPLGNIKIKEIDGWYRCGDEIDMSCRRIVFTNRLLFEILLCMTCEEPSVDSRQY